jgi:hypothetical protein
LQVVDQVIARRHGGKEVAHGLRPPFAFHIKSIPTHSMAAA